ncbi:MAG: division/cell wall cluster transcriptional repressor MraZ [Alphaproteobacteria bacterium]
MALFTGSYDNKLDRKGRVSLPASYRVGLVQAADQLASNPDDPFGFFYLYPSPTSNHYLEGCDHPYMEQLGRDIARLPRLSAQRKIMEDFYMAKAQRISLDQSGRFLLPKSFQTHAQIKGQCLFVGRGETFEIRQSEPHLAWVQDCSPADPDQLEAGWAALDQLRKDENR